MYQIKNNIIRVITVVAVTAMMTMASCNNQNSNNMDMTEKKNETAIFPQGEKASETVFTGTAFLNMLISDNDSIFNCQVYDVVFEPSARNNWHSHPGGQILLVTAGKGYYQERGKEARLLQRGDVVEILPDVVHWHGAAPDSKFTHIGISPNTQKGGAAWFEAVSDEDYKKATK